MYSKKEAALLKEAFWTTFGRYMAPVPSAEGVSVNWVNYKTGVKNVSFFMQADSRKAEVGIKISHTDPDLQKTFFEEFLKLKPVIKEILNEEWDWLPDQADPYGKKISLIRKEIYNTNIFNREDWPALISFFKPRITGLDEFWSQWKYGFEELF